MRYLQLDFGNLIFFENYVIEAWGKLFKGRKFRAKMAIRPFKYIMDTDYYTLFLFFIRIILLEHDANFCSKFTNKLRTISVSTEEQSLKFFM